LTDFVLHTSPSTASICYSSQVRPWRTPLDVAAEESHRLSDVSSALTLYSQVCNPWARQELCSHPCFSTLRVSYVLEDQFDNDYDSVQDSPFGGHVHPRIAGLTVFRFSSIVQRFPTFQDQFTMTFTLGSAEWQRWKFFFSQGRYLLHSDGSCVFPVEIHKKICFTWLLRHFEQQWGTFEYGLRCVQLTRFYPSSPNPSWISRQGPFQYHGYLLLRDLFERLCQIQLDI